MNKPLLAFVILIVIISTIATLRVINAMMNTNSSQTPITKPVTVTPATPTIVTPAIPRQISVYDSKTKTWRKGVLKCTNDLSYFETWIELLPEQPTTQPD